MRAPLIAGLLLGVLTVSASAKPLYQTADDKLSVDESKQVEQFVRRFNRRLRLTRDLTPFILEPKSREFVDRFLLDKDDPIAPLNQDLIEARNLLQLRRCWIAMLNLSYLSDLYVYTTMSIEGIRTYDLPHEQTYPPSVLRLLKSDPIVLKVWKESESGSSDGSVRSLKQLRQLTSTFKDAAARMRVYFRTHPPERDPEYRKNLKYLSGNFKVVYVNTCKTQDDCGVLPLNTKSVTLNVPVLTLVLGWINGKLSIVGLGIVDD